ncbi:hypothetical protein CEXT_2391 [Caerostris extrusa]|uniref:Uncharacterized protein n=1 Tax=Caerostris extrusa TaxID=172846 RepID=A0AAV4XY72_CAEEX|nr:hypothetical protein CEXT_2391 [Caerostris extrusa]
MKKLTKLKRNLIWNVWEIKRQDCSYLTIREKKETFFEACALLHSAPEGQGCSSHFIASPSFVQKRPKQASVLLFLILSSNFLLCHQNSPRAT